MTKTSIKIRRITVSAVFLSIALVLKTYFSFDIPLFGQNGIRIGFSGVFSVMPSILFGPVYGGAVSALSDLLGYFLKPAGTYMPLMTLTAALGGLTRGVIWVALKNKNNKSLRIGVLILVLLAALFGIWNMVSLNSDGVTASFYDNARAGEIDLSGMHAISRILIERTVSTSKPGENLAAFITLTTAGPIGFTAFGLLLLLTDFLINKKWAQNGDKTGIMQILTAMLLSGMVVTTLNTVILRNLMFESWKLLPFIAVWLPRAVEEMVSCTINAYFAAIMYGIFTKQAYLKNLIT